MHLKDLSTGKGGGNLEEQWMERWIMN